MKKILLILFIVFPLWCMQSQEQHTYGPVKENIFKSWVKSTSGTPYEWIDDHQVGTLSYGGQIWETRSINSWEWTNDHIPFQATVTNVTIKFRVYYPHNEDFQFSLHNITYKYNTSGINFFNECKIANKIYEATLSRDQQGYYYFNQSFQSGHVFDAVKNAVTSGNYFITLGIKLNSSSMPVPPYKISSYSGGYSTEAAIDLTIDYTTPNQNYQFFNSIQTNENYGYLIIDNEINNPLPSGTTIFFPWRSQHTVRTAELPFIVNWLNSSTTQKYSYWDLITKEYTLYRSISATPSTPSVFKAKFDPTYSVTITIQLIDDALGDSGSIEFRDPWHYYTDANNHWLQSNQFLPYSTPFLITNDASNSYGGVFLNQSVEPGKPYYSVRVPQSQNIGGYDANFVNWSATGQTQIINPTSLQSPVIFKGANDVVKANYKGHMLSSTPTATGPNNQRKMVTYNEGNNHLITYESQGKIWVTYNDGGEGLVSDIPDINLTPSLAFSSNQYLDYYVWHNKFNDNNKIFVYSLALDFVPIELADVEVHPEISPAPVIACNYISYPEAWERHINIAWTHSDGIDTAALRLGTFHGGEWKRGIFAEKRYRPSIISSGPINELVYFSYDDNRCVYWRRKQLDRDTYSISEEFIVPRSNPEYVNFSGKSQIASHNHNPIVVWEMQEGMAIEKEEPILEEIGGEVDRKPIVPINCPTTFSVCFANIENKLNRKFSSTTCKYFNSPTVTVLNNNVILMAWTDGERLWEARSNDGGGSWATLQTENEGRFPNLSVNADILSNNAHYVFTKGTSSPYEIGLRTNITEEDFKESDTREMALVDSESEAGISIEMPEIYYTTSSEAIRKISFLPASDSGYNIQNIESYLSTEEFTIPQDAESLFIPICMKSKNASALTSSNNKLKVRFRFIPNYGTAQYTAGVWRFENDHYLNKTIRIPVERLRGRKLRLDVSILGLDRERQNIMASATKVYYPEVTNQSNAKTMASNASNINLPSRYLLGQNYPNPFNPLTIINYQLPIDNYITLKVYDVLGREVASLVDDYKSAGYYDVSLDASNMPSGVYVYRLNAGSFSDVKKMLLMK